MKKEYSAPRIHVYMTDSAFEFMDSTTINIKPSSTGDNTIRSKGGLDWDEEDDGFGW